MATKKTILDVFSQIKNEKEAARPDLGLRLWNYLNSITPEKSQVDDNNIPKEITYTLKRLIQGLGSPRAPIRKSYFATLVLLLSNSNFYFGPVTLEYFKEIVDQQLSKYDSKGEEGEVLAGRILAYGVALRSKVFLNGAVDLQREILSEMLTKSKERSYLPLLAYTFITDFISLIDETLFKTVVWPVLSNEILVDWSSQSFETLYCLLEVQNKFPTVLKKKLITSTFKTPSILHDGTIENVQKMLINITWEPRLKHPLYHSVGRSILQDNEKYDLLTKFWECINQVLANSPSRFQLLAIFTVFCSIVKHLDLNQIPSLLTPLFVKNVINSCRPSVSKTDKLCVTGKNTLQLIVSRAVEKTEESSSSIVYKILCKLVFDSGQLLVDKLTGVKVVFPCVSKLTAKHVKLLAKKCENIILLKTSQKEGKTSTEHRWNFKDRCYATQLLARLISHPESQDMDWKIKHLKLMMKYAVFVPQPEDGVQISSELSAVMKNSFFTALSHQLSHLENHRMVLLSLVYYIDNILTAGGHKLRNQLSDEMLTYWKDSLSKIQKIDLKLNQTVKRKTVMYVFQTLFLQMALHIFVDPVIAKDVLNELNRCYKKEKTQLKKLKNNESSSSSLDNTEPVWIEIAVELLLSLLSHDTYMLRQLIARLFPHLCPYLTAQAAFQILQVFDPSSNKNILTDDREESEDESEDDDDDNIDDENDGGVKKASADGDSENESDSDVDDLGDIEDSAIEKTRQAVRDALGIAGSVTDTESIDLDDIDDEEGRKLDAALSEAFKSVKKSQSKNKKQTPGDKALTNFRIRVLDLVDIYLDNNPSLSLVLDTIPTLFTLLAFAIKDNHQKPLENRIRSTIKKIGHLKKCSNVDEVGKELLIDNLKTLMDKGVRSTPVFLNLSNEMSECCTFLLRMGMQITNNEKPKKKSALYDVFATAVDNFFLKRDCLLPISLFENILLKTNWIGNTKLCEQIANLSFDSTVRGFRRNQGLSLLSHFYRNARLLSALKEISPEEMAGLEDRILENAIRVLVQLKTVNDGTVKPSFISELFVLLYTMKNCKFLIGSSKWKELGDTIQTSLCNGSSIANVPRKFVIKLCSALHISAANRQPNISRKRKVEENCSNPPIQQKNGLIPHNSSGNDNTDDSSDEVPDEKTSVSEAVLDCKNVIKKKKSKRKNKKSEEYLNAKRLRNDIANDVEVLKFTDTNLLETS